MNTLIIVTGITGATLFWVLNKWAISRGGNPTLYSFWMLLFGTAAAGALALGCGQDLFSPDVWRFGCIIGLCYAACLKLMLFCMQRGPSGPVVTVNNMGLVWPVTVAFIYPYPKRPSLIIVIGILSILTALILLGSNQKPDQNKTTHHNPPGKRPALSLGFATFMLWIAAGLSMMFQAIASKRLSDDPMALVCIMSFVAVIAIAPMYLTSNRPRVRRTELVPGIIAAAVQVVTGYCIFVGTDRIGAQIVFPFIIATPIIIMLLIGHFAYKEKLNRLGWAGCLLGTTGLLLLILASN